MSIGTTSVGALTGPFTAEAAARGVHGPVRITDQGTRGWEVSARAGDTLLLDEFGDLWWCRIAEEGEARTIRPCWPEEIRALRDEIAASLEALLRRRP